MLLKNPQDLTHQERQQREEKLKKCNAFWTTAKFMIYSRHEMALSYRKSTEWTGFGSTLLYSFRPEWRFNEHKNASELYLIGREYNSLTTEFHIYKAELTQQVRTEAQLSEYKRLLNLLTYNR